MSDYTKYIDDASLLSTNVSYENILSVSAVCSSNDVFGVCCFPSHVSECREFLDSTNVKVISVISFPCGMDTIESKLFSIQDSVNNGAQEIDYVVNISALKDREVNYLSEECMRIGNFNVISKAIIEISILSPHEIDLISRIISESAVDFIKTCTGKVPENMRLSFEDKLKRLDIVRKAAPNKKIKFSGGVSSLDQVRTLINAGIDRIGTSSTVKIIEEIEQEKIEESL